MRVMHAPAPISFTLSYLVTAPGVVEVSLARGLGGDLAAPRIWRGRHSFDVAAVSGETSALALALRRALRRDTDGALPSLVPHGRLLFDLLLPAEVKGALRGASGTLTILGDAPAPWALLHDGHSYLGLRWALGRLAPGALPTSSEPRGDRLLVVADPGANLPAARYEGEALVQALASRMDFDLRLGALRRVDLLRVFKGFRLLHFAGHADVADAQGPGGWRLIDGRLDAAAVRGLAGGAAPGLVFANACRSLECTELVEALLDAGVRHVLGTTVDLPDTAGADFAVRFYGALRGGASMGRALQIARVETAVTGPVWAAYALRGDPSTTYFRGARGGRWASGVRQAAVLAVRSPAPAVATDRLLAQMDVERHGLRAAVEVEGGRLLPGRGAVARAVFGVPVSYEHDTVRAARAALALVEVLAPSTVIVVGAGSVAVSGADVVGGCAAAAEAGCWRAPPGVHVSVEAAARLGGAALLGARVDGLAALRGLIEVVDISPPMVGRRVELKRLTTAFDEVVAGRSRAITLVGPAGIGKSRLVEAALAEVSAEMRVISVGAQPYGGQRPFSAVTAMLRDLLEIAPGATTTAQWAALDGALAAWDGPSSDVLSIEALLAGGPDDGLAANRAALGVALGLGDKGALASHPGEVPVAVRTLLCAAARARPLLLVFEDLHWLPATSLTVVEELMTGAHGVGLMVLATARPAFFERAAGWGEVPGHLRLALGPLDPAEAVEVLHAVAPDVSEEAMEALAARAEGNPLFLRELGLSRAFAPGAGLPATVESVMQARLDRRTGLEREVLRAASVLGRTFAAAGVVCLLDRAEAAETLAALAAAGFLSHGAEGDGWRFTHALLQEVAYRGVAAGARRSWHGRAALWLAELDGERRAEIAAHWAAAEDHAQAARAWLEAAEAAGPYAPEERRAAWLAALVEDGLSDELTCTERATVQTALAGAAAAAGALDEAAARLETALAEAPDAEVAVRAERLRLRAEVDESRGALDDARARLRQASALVATTSDEVGARIGRDVAWLDYRAGDFDRATARLTALLEEASAPGLVGGLENLLGVVAYARGDAAEAARRYRCALAAFEAAGRPQRISACYNNLGILAVQRGDFERGAEWYRAALRIKARLGDRAGLARAYNNLGSLHGEAGEYVQAARYLEEAIKIRDRSGDAALAVSCANLGEVLLKQGAYDRARAFLDRAMAGCEAGGPGYLKPDLWRMRAALALATGEATAALAAAETALGLAEASGDRPRAAAASRVRGQALSAVGREAEGHAQLRAAREAFEALGLAREAAEIQAMLVA